MAKFTPLRDASSFRKAAVATWRHSTDPKIYGTMAIEMSAAQALLSSLSAAGGTRVTVTHLVARAVAVALRRHADINAKVWLGRIVLRDTVDVFVQVAVEGGADLSGAKIERADEKGLVALAAEIAGTAGAIRANNDPALQKSRSLVRRLPWLLVRPFMAIADFLVNTLHLDLRSSGMPADPFGSAMVTSVGMFGIDVGYAPFTPFARCPMVILVGEVQPRPWVVDGKVEVRPVMNLSGTFDHRIIDGYHAGLFAREIRALLAAPEQLV